MINYLEKIYQENLKENVFLIHNSGTLEYKLLKLKKTENNFFKVFSINLLTKTEKEELTFEPLPFLLNNSELALKELNRRIFSFIFDLEIIELLDIKHKEFNLLGFSDFKPTKKDRFISDLYKNYEISSFNGGNKLRNALYYNEEKELYSILLLYPNQIKNFSERKNNTSDVSKEGLKEYLNNFENNFASFKNRIESQFISSKYQLYDFYLSFDFSFNKIKLKEFGIKDLLDFYPLGNYNHIDKLEHLFNIEKLRQSISQNLLFGAKPFQSLNINDYVSKKNVIYANIYDEQNSGVAQYNPISSLYLLLTKEEFELYKKYLLQPLFLEEKKKRDILLLEIKSKEVSKPNQKNKYLTDSVLKLKKLFNKLNNKFSNLNITNKFTEEYLTDYFKNNSELNLCISNEVSDYQNLDYPIIIETYYLNIKKQETYSLIDNVSYFNIVSKAYIRHTGSGNGLSNKGNGVGILNIKGDKLFNFIKNKTFIKTIDSNINTTKVFIEYETKVKSQSPTLNYNDGVEDKFETKYNISSLYKEIMTIDHMLNFKIKHVLTLDDFNE